MHDPRFQRYGDGFDFATPGIVGLFVFRRGRVARQLHIHLPARQQVGRRCACPGRVLGLCHCYLYRHLHCECSSKVLRLCLPSWDVRSCPPAWCNEGDGGMQLLLIVAAAAAAIVVNIEA